MSKVEVTCCRCGVVFLRSKGEYNRRANLGAKQYCGSKCSGLGNTTAKNVPCSHCGTDVTIELHVFHKSKSGRWFCGHSCKATFLNSIRAPPSEEHKRKTSATLRAKYGTVRNSCPHCHKECVRKFCSLNCSRAFNGAPLTKEELILGLQQEALSLGCTPSSMHNSKLANSARYFFGSWNKAVKAAGLVPNTQWMARKRIPCKDGHIADSVSERTLDDWFHDHGIRHEPHKRYPDDRRSCDFYLPDLDLWVEYFGLLRNKRYELEMERKIRFAEDSGLVLVPILPEHLYPNVDMEFLSHIFHKDPVRSST